MCADEDVVGRLSRLQGSRTVIVGMGNTLKGDDGAGVFVCERLTGNVSADVIDVGTVPENYIHKITEKAPENLLVLDAVDFGAPPGTLRVLRPEQLDSLVVSTHTLSPRLFVDLVRRSCPAGVYFVGIQPARLDFGGPLSVQVERAVKTLSQALAKIFPLAAQDQ
jgi:hydrogenase 3 maturation protease